METNLSDLAEAGDTKTKIMYEAAILFARRGYAAVSIRDIAKRVNIKPASIYNHFQGKEALYETIVDNIRDIYLGFYDRMEDKMSQVNSFEEVLNGLFSELIDVYHIYIYYGVSLITTEQFRDPKAREVFNDVLVRIGIDYSKGQFDQCIEKQWVKPFDTETMATMLMNNVIAGTLMRTHEHMKHQTAYDARNMFLALRRYMLDSVEVIKK